MPLSSLKIENLQSPFGPKLDIAPPSANVRLWHKAAHMHHTTNGRFW